MNEENNKIEDDYEFTRNKLKDIIEKGSEAFDDMIQVAKESEHPRAYEVLSSMMKNMADISEKLIDVNKKQKDLTKVEDNQEQLAHGQTTNNVFIGSTAELQKMLADTVKEDIINLDIEEKGE